MGLFGSSSRKGTSVPFGEYFINEYTYQVNGLLFLFMGIITIIKDGYNHLTLRQTYDWSQRIWLIYGIILIALAIITHQGPCSTNIEYAICLIDTTLFIIMGPLQSNHDLKNIITSITIIVLGWCMVGVWLDVLDL
mmetsp:Transcript_7746/g.9634  ORF Transcript_7746/g.9634 Transcript_7746/m.9634 type:complete len:136 (+) Transcript_7746:27-434(+)